MEIILIRIVQVKYGASIKRFIAQELKDMCQFILSENELSYFLQSNTTLR